MRNSVNVEFKDLDDSVIDTLKNWAELVKTPTKEPTFDVSIYRKTKRWHRFIPQWIWKIFNKPSTFKDCTITSISHNPKRT